MENAKNLYERKIIHLYSKRFVLDIALNDESVKEGSIYNSSVFSFQSERNARTGHKESV